MNRNKLVLIIIGLLLVSLGLPGFTASAAPSPNLTPDQWVGRTFVFHTLPLVRQDEGYEIFQAGDANRGFAGDRSAWIPYAEHVYKRVSITNVIAYPAGDQSEYLVYMKERATGMALVGRTMRGQLDGLVLETDLNQARKQFLGKTIFLKKRFVQLDDASETAATVVPVAIGSGAKVIDVQTGIRTDEPIRLVVLVDGQRAVVPIAYSWSNIRSSAWKQTAPWQAELFTDNPRTRFGWPQGVWDQIDAGLVSEGMTKQQVELSWGIPASIVENPDGSGKTVWTYGGSTLTFSGDELVTIENTPLDLAKLP